MYVVKRNGDRQEVHFDKITSRIKKLCYGLNADYVDPVREAAVVHGCLTHALHHPDHPDQPTHSGPTGIWPQPMVICLTHDACTTQQRMPWRFCPLNLRV